MRVLVTILLAVVGLSGCLTGIPGTLEPVQGFDINQYTGTWYEVYRLNHSFERGLSHVTATYTLQDDGSVKVQNRGIRSDGSVSDIEGRAEFQGDPTVGSLRVSFFGPFYGGYHVIALDEAEYQYAMVTGPSFDYLWILSRTPTMDDAVVDQLLLQAKESGFAVEGLIPVDQSE